MSTVRRQGRVGVLSDLEMDAVGINPVGGTLESLIEYSEMDVAVDIEFTRTTSHF